MSYTILTVPFNLKEKAEGEFLNKGFLFDEVFSGYFKSQTQGNPFLHYFNFNPKVINKIATNLFVDLNFPSSNLSGQTFEQLLIDSSFFDKKHLNSPQSYIQGIDGKKVNPIASNKISTQIPNDLISGTFKFCYTKEDRHTSFTIDAVKLYINKSDLTRKSIGFAFIQIILKWEFENAKSMIDSLEPLSELFRYYKGGDNRTNKFELNWNEVINHKVQNLENKILEGKVPAEFIDQNKRKIEEYKRWIIKNISHKISFKLLLDSLLEQISPDISNFFSLEDEEIIKPYVLHLSRHEQNDGSENLDIEGDEVIKKVYRMIRISGSENAEINSSSKLEFVSPDYNTSQFALNEGAFVIEGIERPNELINKYYPSFLFALNQKYLFHYMQEKINELPLIEKDSGIEYDAQDLKRLQQTMIYAEFSQVFTSISNYNEIDQFFEKLREQFKINQLKEEYLDSINGISKITQIKEKEIADALREAEEDKRTFDRDKIENISEFRAQKLNLVLLLLAIAQVWTGLYSSSPLEKLNHGWIYNLVGYIILGLVGILFYRRIDQKEEVEQNRIFSDGGKP